MVVAVCSGKTTACPKHTQGMGYGSKITECRRLIDDCEDEDDDEWYDEGQ